MAPPTSKGAKGGRGRRGVAQKLFSAHRVAEACANKDMDNELENVPMSAVLSLPPPPPPPPVPFSCTSTTHVAAMVVEGTEEIAESVVTESDGAEFESAPGGTGTDSIIQENEENEAGEEHDRELVVSPLINNESGVEGEQEGERLLLSPLSGLDGIQHDADAESDGWEEEQQGERILSSLEDSDDDDDGDADYAPPNKKTSVTCCSRSGSGTDGVSEDDEDIVIVGEQIDRGTEAPQPMRSSSSESTQSSVSNATPPVRPKSCGTSSFYGLFAPGQTVKESVSRRKPAGVASEQGSLPSLGRADTPTSRFPAKSPPTARPTVVSKSPRCAPAVRNSPIWQFFTVDEEAKHIAKCLLCHKTVRRGNEKSHMGTSCLRSHIKFGHKLEWHKLLQARDSSTSRTQSGSHIEAGGSETTCTSPRSIMPHPVAVVPPATTAAPEITKSCLLPFSPSGTKNSQQTISESFCRNQKFPRTHPKVRFWNGLLAKMLALDMLPFSFVEKQGFRQLLSSLAPRWHVPSRTYFSTTAIPQLHSAVVGVVGEQLSQSVGRKVSLTTDMWTSAQSMDYMTVTAHWVSFPPNEAGQVTKTTGNPIPAANQQGMSVRHHATLCLQSFDHLPHNGPNVLARLQQVVDHWLTVRSLEVGFVCADNGSNVLSALRLGGMVHVPCFAHVLNLVVGSFLKQCDLIKEMLVSARKICAHFSRSYSARNALRDYQIESNLPQHQLKLEVPTRWNSTLYMLERLHEQYKAVNEYTMNHHRAVDGASLTPLQWEIMDDLCKVLKPFEEATQRVSRENAGLSEVLPLVFLLERRLQNMADDANASDNHERYLLAKDILACLRADTRVVMMKKSPEYILATLLDPRFKDRMSHFVPRMQAGDQEDSVAPYILLLTERVQHCVVEEERGRKRVGSGTGSKRRMLESDSLAVPLSQSCVAGGERNTAGGSSTERAQSTSLWDLLPHYGYISKSDGHASRDERRGPTAHDMVAAYMQDDFVLGRDDEPLDYWQGKGTVWPALTHLAVEILSCPPGSVFSERVFSAAGFIVNDYRTRLSSTSVERLTFLRMNKHLIPVEYLAEVEKISEAEVTTMSPGGGGGTSSEHESERRASDVSSAEEDFYAEHMEL